MNREEILSRSQQENRGQDIVGLENYKSAAQFAWTVTVCLASLVCFVDGFFFGRACYELMFPVMAGLAALFLYKYRFLRRRHELWVAAFYLIAAVAFLLAWGAQIINR